MRVDRILSVFASLALASVLHAQVNVPSTFANVAVRAGYVAGRTGGNAFVEMPTVAGNAGISLQNDVIDLSEGGEGGTGALTRQFSKFSGPANAPAPASYSNSDSALGGTSTTQGSSNVSPPSGAPTYYTAGWGTTTTSPSSSGTSVNSIGGTYDPWEVTYGSVLALPGATPGGTVDLYYQAGLLASDPTFGTTALGAGPRGIASFNFQTYVQTGASTPLLFNISFDTKDGLQASLDQNGEFSVYLLGANANDPAATPDRRIGVNDAQLLQNGDLTSDLQPFFLPNGTPTRDLYFGFVRRITVPQSGNADDSLFSWHTDSFAQSQVDAVPEPSAFAALGLGALALLRRRKR